MLTAAAAWDELANELYSAATDYASVTSGLAGAWAGRAATSMAQAAAPYIQWLSTTAGQAEQAADQARSAASAHAQLMMLVATNVLGHNSPAIAATEAGYEQMWAQDAVAMYGYAGASTLTAFAQPPATTDPAGLARRSAATGQVVGTASGTQAQEVLSNGSQPMTMTPQALQGLSAPPTSTATLPCTGASTATCPSATPLSTLSSYISKFNTLTGPAKFAMYPMNFLQKGFSMTMSKIATAPAAAAKAVASTLARGVGAGAHALGAAALPGSGAGGGGAAFSAGLGRGMSIGALSAPQSWLATLAASHAVASLPTAGSAAAPWAEPAVSGPAGMSPAGLPVMPLGQMAGHGAVPAASRFELRSTVVPRSPAAG